MTSLDAFIIILGIGAVGGLLLCGVEVLIETLRDRRRRGKMKA